MPSPASLSASVCLSVYTHFNALITNALGALEASCLLPLTIPQIRHSSIVPPAVYPSLTHTHGRTKTRDSSGVGRGGGARAASGGSNAFTSSSFSSLASTVSTTTDPGDAGTKTRMASPATSVDSRLTHPLDSRVPRDESIRQHDASSSGIKDNSDAGQSGVEASTANAWEDGPPADTNIHSAGTKQHQHQQQASRRADTPSTAAVAVAAAYATHCGVPAAVGSRSVSSAKRTAAVDDSAGQTDRLRPASYSCDTALPPAKGSATRLGEGRKLGGDGGKGSRGGNNNQRNESPFDDDDRSCGSESEYTGSGVSSASGSSFSSSRTGDYSEEESDMSDLSSSYSGGGEHSGSAHDSSFSDDYGKHSVRNSFHGDKSTQNRSFLLA